MSLHLKKLMQLNLCHLIYVSMWNLRNKNKLKDGWSCPSMDTAEGELVPPLWESYPPPSLPHPPSPFWHTMSRGNGCCFLTSHLQWYSVHPPICCYRSLGTFKSASYSWLSDLWIIAVGTLLRCRCEESVPFASLLVLPVCFTVISRLQLPGTCWNSQHQCGCG